MRYFVSGKIGMILGAEDSKSAEEIFQSILWELEESYEIVFDSELTTKELF